MDYKRKCFSKHEHPRLCSQVCLEPGEFTKYLKLQYGKRATLRTELEKDGLFKAGRQARKDEAALNGIRPFKGAMPIEISRGSLGAH